VRGALLSSPKFEQAQADALNSLEEQLEARERERDEETQAFLTRTTELKEQLEALREAVKWALHTDVWIDDNPFHGRTLDTKTQVWDNLQAAYDAASSPAKRPT
jgi:hypothetical protein